MRRRISRLVTLTACSAVALTVPVFGFGGRVANLRAAGARVHASIAIDEPFGGTQRAILERGGTLHVRVEVGVWEDRAVFDRTIVPAHVTTFRVIRNPNGSAIALINPGGSVVTYKPYPARVSLDVDACGLDQLGLDAKYYVSGTITIGSLGEEELDEAGEAVFGRDDDPAGLKRVGKFLLNSVLQVKDYVDSVSASVRSDRFSKANLKP